MTLICYVHRLEGYAIIKMDDELQQRRESLMATCRELKEKIGGFHQLALWDCSVVWLEALPKGWQDWAEEEVDEAGEWVELPFPVVPWADFFEIRAQVRTECDQLRVDERGIYWTAYLKHSDSVEVETERLPELLPMEQLALVEVE